ncbi:MAG: hypothetical protein ACP5GY_05045 [Vulcanisaeta sp.]
MRQDTVTRGVIGAVAYVISALESVYVLLQVFNGNPNYYSLNLLMKESLGIIGPTAQDIGQSLIIGPMLMSGYLPIFIIIMIALSNFVIALYMYRIGRLRGLGNSIIVMVAITSLINASLLTVMSNPWQPQVIAVAAAIAMYYYVNTDNKVISAALAALTALISPEGALLNIFIPITHWFVTRNFNESDEYVTTVGVIAVTYYMLANAYSIIHVLTFQGVLNQAIYNLATTAFIQLVSVGTAVPALIAAVLGGTGLITVVPAVLAITLIEAISILKERRIAALVLGVALLMALLASPPSPFWPPYQGTGDLGANWAPLSQNLTSIYNLVSIAPSGRIETPIWASTASLMLKPGKTVVGEVSGVRPVSGTYAICGGYQLIINGYSGEPIINNYDVTIARLITNSTSYTENEGLTIMSGTYQSRFLISTGELTIPPGNYMVSAEVSVTPGKAFMNMSIPLTISTPLSGTVLPVSAYSTISFNLSINFTGRILRIIIYGVSYSEEQANLALTILKNGQVITRATNIAPPITQGLKPYPIDFDVSTNVTPGTYEISITTDQPLILYVSQGMGMQISSGNETTTYPGEAPTYTIIYTVFERKAVKFSWAQIILKTPSQVISMNITGTGNYAIKGRFSTNNWINSSIVLLIITGTPVLPVNVTISPITIKSLEPGRCSVQPITWIATKPGKAILIMLTGLPLAIILPNLPRLTISRKVRKYLVILGLALMLLFYIVWALGFTNLAPQLYSPGLLRIFGILFIIGLVVVLVMSFIVKPKDL